MARVKHVVKKQATIREETKTRRARFPSIAQDRKRYEAEKEQLQGGPPGKIGER